MTMSESLYIQLINQRNMEYTLFHVYKLKAENEKDPILRVIYQKLSDDSLGHMAFVEKALVMLRIKAGREIPKPIMMKVVSLDPSSMRKEEVAVDEVDVWLEEMETASAIYFGAFADEFPDKRLSTFFNRIRDNELEHQKLLKDIKEYRKMKSP